jgi:hypothetical protein
VVVQRAPQSLCYSDRVVIAFAVEFACFISAVSVSREPSRRRVATRPFPAADALETEVRRDERLLIIRELRREARISGAAGLDGDALEIAAAQLEASVL